MADQIQNKHDAAVLKPRRWKSCRARIYPTIPQRRRRIAEQAAPQELNLGDHETRQAMGVIKELVRRMAAMPGQRTHHPGVERFRHAGGAQRAIRPKSWIARSAPTC